jgi:uncharacterized protein
MMVVIGRIREPETANPRRAWKLAQKNCRRWCADFAMREFADVDLDATPSSHHAQCECHLRAVQRAIRSLMNLRDQLKDVLPEILPTSPADAIKGTELIRLVKYRLRQEYSDATLRYHFSILCCDPSSPIAKVDQGQGYYLRHHRMATLYDARTLAAAGFAGLDLFNNGREAVDLALARVAKFRAIFARLAFAEARFPFAFSPGPSPESLWKYPDMALVDWELDESADNSFALNRDLQELKMSLGVQPFAIASVKLTLMINYDNVREVFFQTLSGSRWAHSGELVIATAIADEQLAEDLRRLGAEYGLGVSTLGIKLDALDELADAAAVGTLEDRTFESLQARLLSRQKITSARPSLSLDWRLINDMRREHAEFRELFSGIERALREGRARPPQLVPDPANLPLERVSGL